MYFFHLKPVLELSLYMLIDRQIFYLKRPQVLGQDKILSFQNILFQISFLNKLLFL